MARGRWTVGIDFGGTNVKLGLVSAQGHIVHSQVLPSGVMSSPRPFITGVMQAVRALAASKGVRTSGLRGVGVGAPGPVDVQHGIVHSAVNVPGWHEVRLRRELEQKLGCPCVVDNDANVVALGEWRLGAGRGARELVCLTLGTGIGGGLILNRRIFRGVNGSAGELGHIVINPKGPRCACGARGCLEAHVGTAAIVRAASAAARRSRLLRSLARCAQGAITPELLCCAARKGDLLARQIWIEFGRWLGIGVANLTNIFNPDRIVIGGGVAAAWKWFAPTLKQTVRTQAMDAAAGVVRIVRAQLGNHAGIAGAAVLVWEERNRPGKSA